MNRLLRSIALSAALGLAGCSSDPATFTTYTQRGGSPAGPVNPTAAPRYSDALALNYANFVESEFRARATGARYSREGSNAALAGLSGFTAAAGTLAYSASTVTGLGMAGAGLVQLQHIFDAKGRTNAYADAALRIHAAIKDFVAMNLNHVSETDLTPNGWTLANIVQANADMVNQVLNGHLPTPEDMIQANETLRPEGAMPQRPGTTPVNNISRSRDALPTHLKPLTADRTPPRAPSAQGVAAEVRTGRRSLNDQVVELRQQGGQKRARFILAQHRPAVASGTSPIDTLAAQVDAIRTKTDLQGWQDAFDAVEVAEVIGSQPESPATKTGNTGLPGHQKPAETTGTPTAAPKPH